MVSTQLIAQAISAAVQNSISVTSSTTAKFQTNSGASIAVKEVGSLKIRIARSKNVLYAALMVSLPSLLRLSRACERLWQPTSSQRSISASHRSKTMELTSTSSFITRLRCYISNLRRSLTLGTSFRALHTWKTTRRSVRASLS